MTDAENEEIKKKCVDEVRAALATITSGNIYDRKGYLNNEGYQALERLEGLNLFWICDPKIEFKKERAQVEWEDYSADFYKCPECGYLLNKLCPQCHNEVILPKGGAK